MLILIIAHIIFMILLRFIIIKISVRMAGAFYRALTLIKLLTYPYVLMRSILLLNHCEGDHLTPFCSKDLGQLPPLLPVPFSRAVLKVVLRAFLGPLYPFDRLYVWSWMRLKDRQDHLRNSPAIFGFSESGHHGWSESAGLLLEKTGPEMSLGNH